MFSYLKKMLKKKGDNSEVTINSDVDSQSETEMENKTDDQLNNGVQVNKASENICSNLESGHSVSKNSESTTDFSCDELKGKLYPSIVLTDCLNKGNRLHKLNSRSKAGRRSQRKSAKVAAGKIAQITQSWHFDTSTCFEVNRAPSQRLCAKAAEKRISKIIDMSSSESDEDEDDIENDENQ